MSSPTLRVSVCICTYAPKRDYLERTLSALRRQTFDPARWELIVVDNNSPQPVDGWLNLGGFRSARICKEEKQGLTFARWRAIEQARNDLIVFVDDDNMLHPDFLETAVQCMEERPFLGVIGGRVHGVFEAPPAGWVKCYYPYLALVDLREHPCWGSDLRNYQQWYPRGTGMVLRREVAEGYRKKYQNDPFRQGLGRQGAGLGGSEDVDLVFHAMEAGYAVGYFPQLQVDHLIAPERTTYAYMRKLIYETHYSSQQLFIKRGVRGKPRNKLISYAGNVALCLAGGYYHPVAWWLARQVTNGKHAAWRDLEKKWADAATKKKSPPPQL